MMPGSSYLPADHPYSKESGNAAEVAAKAILESRGNTPRLYRNTLVFLAADKVRLQDLDEALRKYLAWTSIVAEKETLNLDPHQARQAETQKQAAEGAVTARLPETYQWLLVPEQPTPKAPVAWQAYRLTGSDALAVRASKKLRGDELLVGEPRLDDPAQASGRGARFGAAITSRSSSSSMTSRATSTCRVSQGRRCWRRPFATASPCSPGGRTRSRYAESYDEAAARYRGLRAGQGVNVSPDSTGLVVKPHVAARQLDVEVESQKLHGPEEKHFDQGGREFFDPPLRRPLRRQRSCDDFTALFELTPPVWSATQGASLMR